MPNYQRPGIAGGTYFITQVTYQRQPWLCREVSRHALRTAINQVRETRPYCDYIHYNPVHHQLCQVPTEWPFSSVHRLITEGIYPPNCGECSIEFGLDERGE